MKFEGIALRGSVDLFRSFADSRVPSEENVKNKLAAVESSSFSDSSPLSTLPAGERCILLALTGGKGAWGKMASLGFTPGVEISMVQNVGHGPLIVLLRGIRVAMGRSEARQVQIRRHP